MNTLREIDTTFLKEFAEKYYAYKEQGVIPTTIKAKMKAEYDCGDSSYYSYLRKAREAGFITDTYDDTQKARKEREKKIREMKKKTENEPVESTLRRAMYGEEPSTTEVSFPNEKPTEGVSTTEGIASVCTATCTSSSPMTGMIIETIEVPAEEVKEEPIIENEKTCCPATEIVSETKVEEKPKKVGFFYSVLKILGIKK